MTHEELQRTGRVVWRVHCASAPDRVFRALVDPDEQRRYWCESSVRAAGGFELLFVDGTRTVAAVLEVVPPERLALQYFGSRVDFALDASPDGGTDVTVTASDVLDGDWLDVFAGWLNVLLPLKAWVDFGVDLRSHDPRRTWRDRFVDQ